MILNYSTYRHSNSHSLDLINVIFIFCELAINGYASMHAIKRQELIDADFQRLRNLIWPEDDR